MLLSEKEIAAQMLENALNEITKDKMLEKYYQRLILSGQKMEPLLSQVQVKIKEAEKLTKFLEEISK